MYRLLLTSCIVAGALALMAPERTLAQAPQYRPHVPGELLVGFATDQDRERLIGRLDETRDRLRARGEPPAAIAVERDSGSMLRLRIEFPVRLRSRLESNPEEELALLEDIARQLKASDSRIRYAVPNLIQTINPLPADSPRSDAPTALPQAAPTAGMPNDPFFVQGKHWHYNAPPKGMNAVNAWKAGYTGSKDILVAVLDTGLVLDHPDIKNAGNVLPGQNMLSTSGRKGNANDTTVLSICPLQYPPSMNLPSYHGTHVAGTIGGVGSNNGVAVAGINWRVTILPVRVIGPCGATAADQRAGILWAAGFPVDGLPPNRKVDIINMSLGGKGDCNDDYHAPVREAIEASQQAGVIFVISAGNDAADFKDYSPANCPGVISVAASNPDGKLAYYSNFGAVTIMAPGGDIRNYVDANKKPIPGSGLKNGVFSTVKAVSSHTDGVQAMQGTSMAAPHVAGAIALALAKHPEWRGKPDVVAEKLRASAFKLPAGACPEEKPCGPGLLDVVKLINSK